jgi:hypothetical protein
LARIQEEQTPRVLDRSDIRAGSRKLLRKQVLMFDAGNDQDTFPALETFPKIAPNVGGKGSFVGFIKLDKVTPIMGLLQ